MAACLEASPLNRSEVSSDAKWLIHMDIDNLRQTKLGGQIIDQIINKQLSDKKEQLKTAFNFDLDFTKINSLTIYGRNYKDKPDAIGVVMLKTSLKPQQILDTLIAQQTLAGKSGDMLKKIQDDSGTWYSMKDELLLHAPKEGLFLLSKSKQEIEKAKEVMAGKSANLTTSKSFTGYPAVPNAFFFLGMVEGFNIGESLPPQAKVLQMADGGRLVLGENKENFFLNISLRSKTAEGCTQIQQVAQGLLALVSLSQGQNAQLQQLLQATTVSATEKFVTLTTQFPVDKILGEIAKRVPKLAVQVKQDDADPNKKTAEVSVKVEKNSEKAEEENSK